MCRRVKCPGISLLRISDRHVTIIAMLTNVRSLVIFGGNFTDLSYGAIRGDTWDVLKLVDRNLVSAILIRIVVKKWPGPSIRPPSW